MSWDGYMREWGAFGDKLSHLHRSLRPLRLPYYKGKCCAGRGLVVEVKGAGGRWRRRREREKEKKHEQRGYPHSCMWVSWDIPTCQDSEKVNKKGPLWPLQLIHVFWVLFLSKVTLRGISGKILFLKGMAMLKRFFENGEETKAQPSGPPCFHGIKFLGSHGGFL